MKILSSTHRVDAVQEPAAADGVEAELARLRAQVEWLQAEQAALQWAVGHDDLTGLANRRLFATLAAEQLRRDGAAVVVVLDLNGFKPINDRFGHEAGDEVLREVGKRLADCVGENVVARLGGDEFAAVLCDSQSSPRDRWWLPAVVKLSAVIAAPIWVADQWLTVTASVGIAPAHRDAPIGELVRRADVAMYHAKVTGGPHAAWGADTSEDGTGGPGERRTVELALFPQPVNPDLAYDWAPSDRGVTA